MNLRIIPEAKCYGGVLMAKDGVPGAELLPQSSTPSYASLIWALLFVLMRLTACAPPAGVEYVGTSNGLYRALASREVTTVYLTGTVTLDRNDWAIAISIQRNVTVSAPIPYQSIGCYVTLDFANIAMALYVKPGGEITFRWLEMVNYAAEVGQAMLFVGTSPGGRVTFDHVVQRRLAGFGGKQTLSELEQLTRLYEQPGANQTAFFLPRFCFNSTRNSASHCVIDLVYVVDVATRLGPANSDYFAKGAALGEYDMLLEESVQISDNLVDPNCLPGATPSDCVVRQLRLLGIQPVLIKAKPSASNLVKIVASLAILTVAVALFLYFRRHYKTYQERRARRMRRIKEALGMGREAHGIMFNGLDGEVPDWQIMPMPVGYAPDEGGTAELHQDSNIRNFIQDISNRPNCQIPDFERPEDNEVRIEVNGLSNCPITEEVGLRQSAELRLGSVAVAQPEVGIGDTEALPTNPRAKGVGLSKSQECSGEAATPVGAARQPGLKCSDGVLSREEAAAAAVTVHSIRPSGGSGTTGASHHSTSVTSASRAVLLGSALTHGHHPQPSGAIMVSMLMGAGAGQNSSSGGRGASHGLEATSTTMAVTKAGMDVLLASRTAAMGSGGVAAATRSSSTTPVVCIGSTVAHGMSQSRSNTSKEQQAVATEPSTYGQQQGKEQQQEMQQQQQQEQARATGSGGQLVDGAGAGTAAAATRHAITFAAADVATRVMRSKDSDDDMEEDVRASNGGRVASLMDELDQLRRDIMAGINDTQLQIMSVVGSGAFGTVYRGQWQGLEVAVKTIVFSASSENRKRALQEAALCQSINHRNIVATYAVDVQPLGAVNTPIMASPNNRNSTLSNLLDWRLYIVQEYCDGGPLRKLVQSQYLQTSHGPNMPVICEVALELAQALAHLHSKNVIHGDLNPNNVLLKRDASSPIGFRVKMADFGLSVMVPLQKTHMSNLRLGTLYYIAPETCFRGQLGYAADVFSLGVMLWELYHGRLAGTRTPTGEPRYQPDFPDFPATCPVDYRKLAHRCLQKQPHNRLHSSQVVQRLLEMLTAFRAATGGAPLSLPPLPLGGPEESPLPPQLTAAGAGQVLTHQAITAAGTKPPSGVPTPAESRHRPTSPTAAVAAAASSSNPEISPYGGTESPRTPAAMLDGQRI